jgi:Family of unknown function (DUF5691)
MDCAVTPRAIIDALMQGTGRRPLQPAGVLGEGIEAGSDATPARLLALAVQAQLHALPPAPDVFDTSTAARDERPIVPKDVRPLILRLVTGKGNPPDDPAALALAQGLDRHGYRLHPFDVPRVAPFVRKHSALLGLALAEAEGAGSDHWSSWETLDEANWMLATPARKANFIAELRLTDAANARALVEAQLPLEKAEVRLRLIDALGARLSSADRPLLESLAGDRAPTVKRAVTRLLARLPGTGAAEAQIAELLSRITQNSIGLLRRRVILTLQMPANVKSANAEIDWLATNFGGIGCTALAQAFGMTPESLLEAAHDDGRLLRGIAFSACAERNWPIIAAIANGRLVDIWAAFLQTGLASFGLVTPRERSEWASAAIPARLGISGRDPYQILALHRAMEGPLPLAQARAVFQAAAQSRHMTADLLTAAAALMPDGGLGEMADKLAQLPPEAASRAQLLAQILIRLNEGPRPS